MAAVIPKRVLEDIRARCDIAEVIGSYVRLQRSGSSFKALCPFHKEKTPSFHVNPQRQIYHCFGCGAGGDVFGFVMAQENVDFMTAVRMLAERAGIKVETEKGEPGPKRPAKEKLYRLLAEAADFYHRCLQCSPRAEKARAYLQKRSLPPEIQREFLIGYAPDSWDAILKWGSKKYSVAELEAAGLVAAAEAEEGGALRRYDRFRDRIMFPIRDEQGRTIGFSGRTLQSDPQTAKYVNSPESALFHKSRVLYALDKARQAVADARTAIVCEGQIDVIRCHQAGFRNAVAAQGTAFTEEHARVLHRYADEVVLVFDPDRAGQDAAVKAARVFLQAELAVRVAALPPGEDPDAFLLRNGAEAFAARIAAAKPVVEFQIDLLATRHDMATEAGLLRVTREVLETIAACPNAVQRAEMIQRAAPRLRHTYPGALQAELEQILRRRPVGVGAAAAPPPAAAHPREERELAEHLAACPELGSLLEEHLPLAMVSDPHCRSLIEAVIEADRSGEPLCSVLAQRADPGGELGRLAAEVQMAPAKIGRREYSHEDAVKDMILYIWRRELKRRVAELEREMATDAGQRDERLRAESAQIRADIKALNKWESGEAVIRALM